MILQQSVLSMAPKNTVDVHRYFNSSNGGHFFTSDEAEKSVSDVPNIIDEGTIFQVLSEMKRPPSFLCLSIGFSIKKLEDTFSQQVRLSD